MYIIGVSQHLEWKLHQTGKHSRHGRLHSNPCQRDATAPCASYDRPPPPVNFKHWYTQPQQLQVTTHGFRDGPKCLLCLRLLSPVLIETAPFWFTIDLTKERFKNVSSTTFFIPLLLYETPACPAWAYIQNLELRIGLSELNWGTILKPFYWLILFYLIIIDLIMRCRS